jgi:hypothetical protein
MAGHFGLEGVREVGSRSGERRQGSASVTGRGSRPAGGGGFVAERPEEEDEGVWPACL